MAASSLIEKVENGTITVVVYVYAYGPETGPNYAAMVTYTEDRMPGDMKPGPVTQLGMFDNGDAANACVVAVAAQVRVMLGMPPVGEHASEDALLAAFDAGAADH